MTKIVKSDRVAQGAAQQWRVQHCQIFIAKTLMGAVLAPSETELNRPAKHVVAAQLWRVSGYAIGLPDLEDIERLDSLDLLENCRGTPCEKPSSLKVGIKKELRNPKLFLFWCNHGFNRRLMLRHHQWGDHLERYQALPPRQHCPP